MATYLAEGLEMIAHDLIQDAPAWIAPHVLNGGQGHEDDEGEWRPSIVPPAAMRLALGRVGIHLVPMASAPGPLETLVSRLNALQARALIGEHAIGGAMAFIYWAEPFETKDLDVFAVLPTTATGLIHLAPIREYLVEHGGIAEGQFIRLGRLLLDFVPASDALDEEAIAEAVPVRVGDETTRVFTPEHAVAIALRTWRGKDREHIDRLIRTGRRPLDVDRLQSILARYGLGEKWRRFKEMYDVDLG